MIQQDKTSQILDSAEGQTQNGYLLNPFGQHLKSMGGFLRAPEQPPKQGQAQHNDGQNADKCGGKGKSAGNAAN